MNKLPALQQLFQDHVLHPHSGSVIEGSVVSDAKATAQTRLDIYASAYRMRLGEALEQDFTALHTLLGDEQFEALCLSYIDAHPSRHYSLRYLGRHMSAFLREHDFYARQPVLAELAAFEWMMVEAFDAADSDAVTLHDLARLPAEQWGQLLFSAHPSVQRLELFWNVPALWGAAHQQHDMPQPQRDDTALTWLVWRRELKTWYRSLGAEEAWAWHAACAGHDFGEICSGLCRWVDEDRVPATAAGMLQHWINDGLVSAIRYPA